MANTKVPAELSSTPGIIDNSTATAITIDSAGAATFVGTVTADGLTTNTAKLKAIAASNSDTAVDVFIYDTRKDSDGGAWRKRTQHTSWYNETLNTATRGARKEFPSVAVIVAEAYSLTIYDGDTPDMPMWMVATMGTGQGPFPSSAVSSFLNNYWSEVAPKSITAINGSIFATTRRNAGALAGLITGMTELGFIEDTCYFTNDSNKYKFNRAMVGRDIVAFDYTIYTTGGIANVNGNDLAVTVLPNAPIDADTGLPVPTIAVATDGGVSVIKDDGAVVDITFSNATYAFVEKIVFDEDNRLYFVNGNNGPTIGWVYMFKAIPSADNVITLNTKTGSTMNADAMYDHRGITGVAEDLVNLGATLSSISGKGFGSPTGLTFIAPDDVAAKGMVAYTASDYNTGWMNGDIKLATLSDTDTTNVTGGTQPDRSYNNNALNVTGTITKTAVATGAELVGYTPSGTSYLRQPSAGSLTLTSDFSITWWQKYDGSGGTYEGWQIVEDDTSSATTYDKVVLSAMHEISSSQYLIRGVSITASGADNGIASGAWTCMTITKTGGKINLYTNGKLSSTAAGTCATPSNAYSLEILRWKYGDVSYYANDSAMALFRTSNTVPSAEQIAKMYNDEKFLFQENAQVTLYGASDAVTALAYDDHTELLHVGTSAGRSEFQGLRRINNTTDAVGTAISASNGLVAED